MALPAEKHDYPIANTTITSYYQHSSTTPAPHLTTLTTVVISKTATLTLTTVELITSRSTVVAPAPTYAPALSSTDVGLPPGKITGIGLGVLFGIILIMFTYYTFIIRRTKCPCWPRSRDGEDPVQTPNKPRVNCDTGNPPESRIPIKSGEGTPTTPFSNGKSKHQKKKQEKAQSPMSPRPSSILETPRQWYSETRGQGTIDRIPEQEGGSEMKDTDKLRRSRAQRHLRKPVSEMSSPFRGR
ncbi:hypothetical protein NPX13_g4741 [Xylaria arbuscula]|uniref:Uncharacterized protein n=1 Tax=Xylaria arbuscula TaxID=114810 RepID=A0A9W8NFQ0_9PEZI|nr:hypothetical protein NPX13_g4741 [Xylaria arbuscula]